MISLSFKSFLNKLQTANCKLQTANSKQMASLSINATNAYDKLMYIITIISKDEGSDKVFMKCLIRELTIVVNGLSNSEKIAFIKMFSICFKSYYSTFPEAMELYFTQIITIIDANLHQIIDFTDIEFMELAELSNNTMRMFVTEFEK